jgi:hypothetical protein
MSYRALITLQSLNKETGEVENQCHATLGLDDGWENAEKLVHELAKEKFYPHAAHMMAFGGEVTYRGVDWAALDSYRQTYADQEWVVTYQLTPNLVRIKISGYDGGSKRELIFFRSIAYCLADL